MDVLKYSRQQAAELAQESLSIIDDAIASGDLASFIVGRRRFVRPAALRAWIDWLEKQSNAGHPVCYRRRA